MLLLIELMTVFVKALWPFCTYDKKVLLREKLEFDDAKRQYPQRAELKKLCDRLAFKNNAEATRYFFIHKRRPTGKNKKIFSNKWKEENGQPFVSVREKTKQEILAKQDN